MAKFKVGDRVIYKDEECEGIGTVHSDNDYCGWFVTVEPRHQEYCPFHGGTTRIFQEKNLQLVNLTGYLIIEVGKFYRTRNGEKVGPMRRYIDGWCVSRPDGRLWCDNELRYFESSRGDSDLISEWTGETVAKPAIVCLMENGQPLPSEKPHVHATVAAAEKEAQRLAGIHKGKEFAVFELGASKREEPTYSHEWQRLAATGDRLGAIKSLRQLGGMSLTSAWVAVRHFLDEAA